MNESHKLKIFDHMGLKFVALILAFCVWLIVMNIDDYKVTRTFANIPVEQLNGNMIEQQGMVYDVVDGEEADIVVKGPRSVVEGLSASDFRAYADLSHLSVTNTAEIKVEALNTGIASQISIENLNTTMTLSIEETASVELPVKIVTTGEVSKNFALGTCVPTPNIITVEGPESVLSGITEIRAVVNLGGASETHEEVVNISAFDAYGKSLENKHISLSSDQVTVNVPVYPTKEVPIEIETKDTPAEGFSVISQSYNPQSVVIYGEKETLAEVEKITISDISLAGAEDNIEKNAMVSSYLPEGTYLLDPSEQIAINIAIEKHIQKKVGCTEADIAIKGKDEKLKYKLTVPSSLTIIVSGLAEYVDPITISDIRPSLDFKDLEVGEHEVKLDLNPKSKVDIIGEYTLKLVIEEIEENTEDNTEETVQATTEG
jgi:Uncharacterized protein conserved in bacteria